MSRILAEILNRLNVYYLFLTLGITGFILYFFVDKQWYFLAAGFFGILYCLIGFFVYIYNNIKDNKANIEYQNQHLQQRKRAKDEAVKRALLFYSKLSPRSKSFLQDIVKQGTKTDYPNIYLISRSFDNDCSWKNRDMLEHWDEDVFPIQNNSYWVSIEETQSTATITIEENLNNYLVEITS